MCKCTENQVVNTDFAMQRKCLRSDTAGLVEQVEPVTFQLRSHEDSYGHNTQNVTRKTL